MAKQSQTERGKEQRGEKKPTEKKSTKHGRRRVHTDIPTPGSFSEHQLWTAEDFRILHQYYPTKGPEWVARKLGRTPDAVKIKASRVGIKTDWLRAWTKKEIKYIVSNYHRKSNAEIAEALNRTPTSVAGAIQSIRAKMLSDPDFPHQLRARPRPPSWTEKEVKVLRENFGMIRSADIAAMLGRTMGAVQAKAAKLGLVAEDGYRKAGKRPYSGKRFNKTVEDLLTEEQKTFILAEMHTLGCPEIARRLSVSYSRVFLYAKRHGYNRETMARRWSKSHLDYLRKHHTTMLLKDIAHHMGRTPDSVRVMARTLGLSSDDAFYQRKRSWSKKDIALLRKLYPKKILSEIAVEMGRTEKSVRSMAKELKLHQETQSKYKREALWKPEQVALLRKHYGKMTYKELSAMIGRDVDSISNKAVRLGLVVKKGKPSITPRTWTAEEDELMRKQYGRKSVQEIADMLGRTRDSVQKRGAHLSVGGERRQTKPGRSWNAEEDAFLRKHYGKLTVEEFAKKFDRTLGSIKGRFKTLKLTPPPKKRNWEHRPWLPEEEEFLRREIGRMKRTEIARRLGRTVRAVNLRGMKLGLVESRPRHQLDRRWTKGEETLLRKLYGTMTYKEIAERMGRTTGSVQGHVRTLGIVKKRGKK